MRILSLTLYKRVAGALEGFILFSRCLYCSKSITSSQSVLRVGGYCKSAWCQARLVIVTAGGGKLFGQQGPSRGRHVKEAVASVLNDRAATLVIVCHYSLYYGWAPSLYIYSETSREFSIPFPSF